MATTIDRPATGVWHELVLGVGSRRLLAGTLVGLAVAGGLTPVIAETGAPVGLYVLALLPAAVIGRLWPGVITAVASFVLATFFVSPPAGSFEPRPYDWVVLGLFLLIAGLVAVEEAARARARSGQDRLAFLAEANRTLTTSLDYDRTIAELTRLAVPRLADWCAVVLREGTDATLTQYVAHSDPTKVELAEELWRRYPPDLSAEGSPLGQVLGTGRSLVLPRVPQEMLERRAVDDEHRQILRDLGLRSAIVVPLVGPRGPIGALTLIHSESGRRYAEADLAFAEELARTASMAIENARLHQERTRIAQTLQNSLLPTDIPDIPGVEVAVRYRPAGEGNLVGGDFYDVFDAGGDTWAVALGDVCGKGPEAAALTGLVRQTIRTATLREDSPSSVLSLVNRQILGANGGRFCTVALGTVHRSRGRVRLLVSCGGHPSPLIYRRSRTVEAIDCLGTLLGVFPDPKLDDGAVELFPGDAIVFYTDGVTERFERNGDAGDARLVALLWESEGLDAAAIADRIYREAAVSGDERPRDDIAIVVLRVPPAA